MIHCARSLFHKRDARTRPSCRCAHLDKMFGAASQGPLILRIAINQDILCRFCFLKLVSHVGTTKNVMKCAHNLLWESFFTQEGRKALYIVYHTQSQAMIAPDLLSK